jgi:hypothetical protein
MPQCTAHSQQSGERCEKDAVAGFTVCEMHGGKTPVGADSPHFKHGRWSKHLPKRMVERSEEARRDPELTALTDEIALIDARIADMLERVDTGESGEVWASALACVEEIREIELRSKASTGDTKTRLFLDREVAMSTLVGHIQEGMADYAAWREVLDLVERRRKLCMAEWKRLAVLKLLVPVGEVLTMQAAIAGVIRAHVKDPDALRAISADLDKLVQRP